MSDPNRPWDGADSVDRWLADRHDRLVGDLAPVLDTGAGLDEILAPTRAHRGLGADVDGVLDVDTGLAAIVSGTVSARSEPLPGRHVPPREVPSLLVAMVGEPAPGTRLAIRNRPALAILGRACDLYGAVCAAGASAQTDLVPVLDRARDRLVTGDIGDASRHLGHADAVVRALRSELDRTPDLVADIAGNLHLGSGPAFVGDILHARGLALTLTTIFDNAVRRGLELDLVGAVASARELVETLDRARAGARLLLDSRITILTRELATVSASARTLLGGGIAGLAEALAAVGSRDLERFRRAVHRARHDFAGADLHDVDLRGVELTGVRWSTATRWPPGWAEEIRDRSVEVSDGIFEIQDRGHRVDTPDHSMPV